MVRTTLVQALRLRYRETGGEERLFFNDTNMAFSVFYVVPPMGRDFKDCSVLHSASIGIASVQDVSRPPSQDTTIVSETDKRKDKVKK